MTGAGARLLGQDLAAPLMDVGAIEGNGSRQLVLTGPLDRLNATLAAIGSFGLNATHRSTPLGNTTGSPERTNSGSVLDSS